MKKVEYDKKAHQWSGYTCTEAKSIVESMELRMKSDPRSAAQNSGLPVDLLGLLRP